MNEFTKEELTYIIDAIDNDIVCFDEPDIAYFVRDKLKSMIENYCEHENDGKSYLSYPALHKCIKCGEYFR